jgi:transposase
MLSLPTSVRVYLARGPTDMRKSIDGLAAVTQQVLERDPLSGHLFVFCNRRRDRIKILYWETSGYWLLHKRLDAARSRGRCLLTATTSRSSFLRPTSLRC